MSSSNVYILRLKGGFYYIGRSSNVMERYAEHVEGRGSSWTALHKPISILRIIPNCSNFDEDKYVKEYMAKYGIDMVRGGAYSNCELDDEQIRLLEREILGASDKCYNCGRKGHFASDCRAAPASATSSSNCKRCGRSGHVEKNCYATKDIYGDEIDDGDSDGDECYRCGRDGHYARDCYAKRDIYGDEISDESDDDLQVRLQSHQMSLQNLSAKQTSGQCPAAPIVEVKLDKDIVHCYRCGCEGHYAHDCHATHHIYGDEIDD